MWPFKKKIQPVVVQTPVKVEPPKDDLSIDCVFQNILTDLKTENVDLWEMYFGWSHGHLEHYRHLHKEYELVAHPEYKEAHVAGCSEDVFTKSQQRQIYKACQEMYAAIQKKKEIIRLAEAHQRLKSTFPNCVK